MATLKNLTIAIITNRPHSLKKCLASIYSQKYQPGEILLIKNKQPSIPQKRNMALKRCHTKFLAFIDDDCILDKNWTISAYKAISNNKNLTYVVGSTKLLNNHSLIARTQYDSYLQWFNQTHTLDTKNIIFNFNRIKHLQFDTNLKIFEDVDFDLQLKSNKLIGDFSPKMLVHHPEVSNLFQAIKKNYFRGQYKSIITNKWGNFDNFVPSIPPLSNPINFILKTSFNLGYILNPPRPIVIVNHQDHGANEQRMETFYKYLHDNHHYVVKIDSFAEFQKVIASRKYLLIYGLTLIKYKILKSIVGPDMPLVETMVLKANIIHRLLTKLHTSLAIIQYPEDMLVCANKSRSYKTLYDSPTIFFKELELSEKFNKNTISQIKHFESAALSNSDFVSFHWYTYFKLAKNINFKVNHPTILNWTCTPQTKLASYKPICKTIHIGKLNSYWVNPKLLSHIADNINLDIYSYETPDPQIYPSLKKFKGRYENESILSKYQFGLLTISDDDIRKSGFSAKYLLYLSYGLPVLCPSWRHDPLLSPATIYYNQSNIKTLIKKYQNPILWQQKHQAALKLSKHLSTDNNLVKLLFITNDTNKQNS